MDEARIDAARRTIASLEGHIVLYPTDPCLAPYCYDPKSNLEYPVHYDVKAIVTTPRAILLRTVVVSKDAENGSDRVFVIDLAGVAPIVFLKGYGNAVRPVIALEGKEDGQSLALGSGDEDLTRQAVQALLLLRMAAANTGVGAEQRRFDKAADAYRAATPKPRPSAEIRELYHEARAAADDKDFVAAEVLYARAIAIAPWWPEGHYGRGLALGEIGAYRDASAEMQRYLVLAPDAPDADTVRLMIDEWRQKAP